MNPHLYRHQYINYYRQEKVGPGRWHVGRGHAPGTRAPGPAPLGPVFTWLPPGWAWILASWWAWPDSRLKWPFSSSPSNMLSRKAYFLLCSACFCPYFCICDNSRVQLETRHYHMYMCVLLFIPSFLVECWWYIFVDNDRQQSTSEYLRVVEVLSSATRYTQAFGEPVCCRSSSKSISRVARIFFKHQVGRQYAVHQ
jgi:hypothetical protein